MPPLVRMPLRQTKQSCQRANGAAELLVVWRRTSLQQALAANLDGVRLNFSAFGDPESCDAVLRALREQSKPMAAKVANALKFSRDRNFVQDLLAAVVAAAPEEEKDNTFNSFVKGESIV